MPSSEECLDAQARVRKWYTNWLIEKEGHPKASAEKIASITNYEEMRSLFVKETKTYIGPYSAY